MFAAPAFIIGAIIGWIRAGKFGGNRMDKMQYALAHAFGFFLLALAVTVFADWQGWV